MTTPPAPRTPSMAAAASAPRHDRTITIKLVDITDHEFAVLANDLWNCANSAADGANFTFSGAHHDGGPALNAQLNQEWADRSQPRWR